MAKKKPIKLNDQQLMLMADNVSDIYRQLCNDLFDNVVERLHDRGTYYLDQQPYLWQLEKMADVGMLNDHNIKLIAEYSGIAEKQIRYIIENEGYQVYKDTHAQLKSNAYDYTVMKDLISYSNQAIHDVHNLINTTLPKSVQATYKDIIETTVAKVITGMATPQKALDETIMKFQERGFYGYTDRAGRRQRADAYARTVIKTTARRTFNEMRMRPAQELGIDTFYYSIKPAAREMCAPLQHQIVTTGRARTEEGVKIFALDDYGYGKPGGCQGINCGHTMTPFIPGANYMPDIDDDLKSLTPEQAIENANAQSKQRAIERSIRQSKEMLHVAEKLGDQELIDKYKSKVRIQQGAMRDYLKQHPFLHRDYAREKYYDDPFSKAKKEVKLREEQKKARELATKRAELDKAVKSGKMVSVSGVTVGHTPPGKAGEPNSVVQHNATNGDVLGRTYYDDRGYKVKDIHFTNHKQPDKHPYGKKGEHVHDFVFDDDGKFISRTTRELTNNEREENLDILWRY